MDRRAEAEAIEHGAPLTVAALLDTVSPRATPDSSNAPPAPGPPHVEDDGAVEAAGLHVAASIEPAQGVASRDAGPQDVISPRVPGAALTDVRPEDDRDPARLRRAAPGEVASSAESRLAEAIAEVAGRFVPGAVGLDDDFFDCGGTSTAAVEFTAAVARELGVALDLDDVFADARPRQLAASVTYPATAPAPIAPAAVTRSNAPDPPAATSTAASSTAAPGPVATPPAAAVPCPPVVAAAHLPGTDAAPLPLDADGIAEPASPTPETAANAVAAAAPSAPPSPQTVATRRSSGDELDGILADLAIVDRLPWVGAPEPEPPRQILLTGATGFLGGHLLLDLLRHTDAHVICLVRAEGQEAGWRRLAQALTGFRLPWSGEVRRRVTVLPGDLRRPRLGVDEADWAALSTEVDSIVNVGAAVDFLRGYPSLRAGNVLGPITLAELAATGRVKPLHHVSTLSVFNEAGRDSMAEEDPVAHLDRLTAGYDKSKWAAEAALRRARDHGLVVTLLRPGGIGGHTRTGAHNPRDLSSALLAAVSRFRTLPAFRALNVASVDWISRVITAIVAEPTAWGHNYHLSGVPTSLADVMREMSLSGMAVRVQDWRQWRAETVDNVRTGPVPELEFLARVLENPAARGLVEAALTAPPAAAARTDAFVAAQGLPPAARYDGRAQLATLQRLTETGFAAPPDPQRRHLWFEETVEGKIRDIPCRMMLTLSIASMQQVLTERRIDVRGELRCLAVHRDPVTVVSGSAWVRPQEGVPLRHGLDHPLLTYRLRLRDIDGRYWWLEGRKTARAGRDLWRQARTLAVEIGPEGEPGSLTGVLEVPAESYVREQIDGIQVDPALPPAQQRAAKALWLGWFGTQVGRGLLRPMLRAGSELLELRRGVTGKDF